ncbi:hypothetical protein L484_014463 [Morus notabilis]|uniref:Uncharacterized protein n=1 Tax=Morus notabilis TaxID=981085 RepID=W9QRX4_9ROSA|nr:hypothetical protein L484_014463 [Morus notabilis]
MFLVLYRTMVYARQKEDPWNSIIAGAATGGFLQMRPGFAASGGDGLNMAKMARIGGSTEEGLPAAGRDLHCSPWCSDTNKFRLGAQLVEGGYEGRLIVLKVFNVVFDSNSDESVVVIGEEIDEGFWDFARIEELEDETRSADVEMECGDGVGGAGVGVGTPLDVKVDDEHVESAAVDEFSVSDPIGDHGGSISD